MGPVEAGVRAAVDRGDQLDTPTGAGRFAVQTIDDRGVVLLLGVGQAPTLLTWSCLEGIPGFLSTGAWVRVAGRYDTAAEAGTLDHYLKKHVNRATAGWVASLLERAGVVDLDRGRPARVRLRKQPWERRSAGEAGAGRAPHGTVAVPGRTFVCSVCMLRKSGSQRRGPDICVDCA